MSSGGNGGSSSLPLSNGDVSALSSVVAPAVSRTLAHEQSQRRGNRYVQGFKVTRVSRTVFMSLALAVAPLHDQG